MSKFISWIKKLQLQRFPLIILICQLTNWAKRIKKHSGLRTIFGFYIYKIAYI